MAAPIIVILLRMLQGLALGGEYGGAAIYVAEHAPPKKRGFYTSFIQASVVGGFVLSRSSSCWPAGCADPGGGLCRMGLARAVPAVDRSCWRSRCGCG